MAGTAVIAGPGATGTVLASSLLRAGWRVRLLARDAARAEKLRAEGLRLDGGRLEGLDAISHRGADLAPADLVCLCVKSYDVRAALQGVRAASGPGTVVLSIQNGLSHVVPVRRALGTRVVFAAAYFAALRGPEGVRRLGGNALELGLGPRNQPAARRLEAALKEAGWEVKLVASESRLLWTKLALNAAINPLGALAACPNGELAARPALKELLMRAVEEARLALQRVEVEPLQRRLDLTALRLCRATAGNLNSMAQDLADRKPTEADSILLPLLRNVPVPARDAPVLYGLYRFVKGLERERARTPGGTR